MLAFLILCLLELNLKSFIIKDHTIDPLKPKTAEEVVIEVMRHFGFRRNYQVAKYFDVTPQTLSGWIKTGDIPLKHMLKFEREILLKNQSTQIDQYTLNDQSATEIIHEKKQSFINFKKIIYDNIRFLVLFPFFSVCIVSCYVFFFADPVYTSKSKVLPISEDGSSSNSFSGFASQLGISIPLNMGGKVPWDEIYPEIIKSGDLLESMLDQKYLTNKYGEKKLIEILIKENDLLKFNKLNQRNRAIDKLRSMIKVSKDRASPIVKIEVSAFEPVFASNISNDLILKSSLIQRQLKTNRVRNKRIFIEDRLEQVSLDMKKMESDLRMFRENNRNLSSSPSLSMKLQEMGREVDLQNSLYVTLKTQYEKAKIDEVGRDDMVQKIDGPNIPTRLTSPKRFLSILMTLFISLFTSSFLIYFKENLFKF